MLHFTIFAALIPALNRVQLFKRVCSEFLVEAFYPAAALNGFLLSGIERMALRADIYSQRIDGFGRADLELRSASAGYVYYLVLRLNIFLHFSPRILHCFRRLQ